MKKELITEITINAAPEKVWSVLTDFENFPNWNPFIKSLTGDVAVGNQIKVFLEPPGGKAMTFNPIVLAYTPNKEFRWIGKLFVKGIFDGEHKFELIANNDGTTRLIHSEKFSGLLIPLFGKMLDIDTKNGFIVFNEVIKERAEKL